MNRSFASVALLAFATPVFAGSAPGFVSSFDVYTSTFARTGTVGNPIEVNSDTDTLASFFGMISSSSLAQDIRDGDVEGAGRGDASLTVSGTNTVWNLQSVLDSNAHGLNVPARGDADFFFTVNMNLLAGQSIDIGGTVSDNYDGSDKSFGYGFLTISLFRDDSLLFTEEYNHGAVSAFESVLGDASYRLEIAGRSDSAAYAGPGGWYSSDVFTTNLTVSVIPAPMSAAPLAFGALLAARRRRG